MGKSAIKNGKRTNLYFFTVFIMTCSKTAATPAGKGFAEYPQPNSSSSIYTDEKKPSQVAKAFPVQL